MSDTENITRMLCSDTGTPRWKIRKGMYDDTYNTLIKHLETSFSELPFTINTKTDVVENLRPQVKRWVEAKGLTILYVDYLQLLLAEGKYGNNRANEVQTISRTLKLIAMENNIPVVSLCQFNRGAGNAGVFEILSHLKESSAIEQDASTVSYIQIEKSTMDSPDRSAELTVLKNRNGATFKPVKMNYHGPTFTFTENRMQ
jgi:replicative DNA helicase